MRRVVLVNRYFHPDHSATSQIASDLAFHLAARGWEVVALSSAQRYDDPRARLVSAAERGVRVRRLWTTRFGRMSLPGRALDYLSFYVSAFFALLSEVRHRTVVIAMTDPPLLSIVAAVATRLRRGVLVNWIQDLFPEVAEALGMKPPGVLRRMRDWSLRRARMNVVLGERMKERVAQTGVSGLHLRVIHNWADGALRPVPRTGGPFVVAYSGNLGRVHEFETILRAMELLKEETDIRFLIVGGGAQLERVRREARGNVEFRPYAPREQLSESLSAGDVHLVSLQPRLEGLIVPSKFYGIVAVARPVIFIGAADGELARLVDEHRCGVVVAPGDAEALASAIRSLAADRAATAEMGRRGRDAYDARFSAPRALAAWERTLEEVAS
ncbi:MAG TPA: glycosyltransferase family 4 protein [Thermoanaerobaculia bacterium]|jgi:glycosyltransferase involved in cell wall biosynthesis